MSQDWPCTGDCYAGDKDGVQDSIIQSPFSPFDRGLSPAVRYMGIRFLGIRYDLEIQSYINFHVRDTVHVILMVSSHADETICGGGWRQRSEIFQFCFFSLLSLVE